MHRDKSAEMAIWQKKNSHFVILALSSLCIDILLNVMKDLLHTFAQKVCPAMSRGVYVVIQEDKLDNFKFPSWDFNILLDLGSWDNFGRLGSRIRDGPFHVYLKSETRSVMCVNRVL